MNKKNLKLIFVRFFSELKQEKFTSIYDLLVWTDLNIWNLLNLHKNKQLNENKRLMNYYVQLIKMIMTHETYQEIFNVVYKKEKESTLIKSLTKDKYDSYVFVLKSMKILRILIKKYDVVVNKLNDTSIEPKVLQYKPKKKN